MFDKAGHHGSEDLYLHGCDRQHAADLFGLRAIGNVYSRIGNPTVVRAFFRAWIGLLAH